MTMSWFSPLHPPPRVEVRGEAWKSILVPLDGSDLSRWAVGGARSILKRPGIALALLRVIECAEHRSHDLGYQMDARHGEARESLSKIREGFGEGAAEISADLRFGDPATEILRELAEGNHDVALLSAFGRGGPGQALLGNVARRVLRSSPVPLILFRPRRGADGELPRPAAYEETRFQRLLVALDGSEAAEEIVPAAERMARTLGSVIFLFRAVAAGSREDAGRRLAEDYLGRWASVLASRGIVSRRIVRTSSKVRWTGDTS